ncbi:MAG: hypothetical protein ACRD3G_04805 [Vicinamibacterales bacterium]
MFLVALSITAVIVACAAAAYAWRVARQDRLRSEARVAALAAAIDGTAGDVPAAMFERAPRTRLQGRPLLKLGVGFAMAVGIIVLVAMSSDRRATSAAEPPAAPTAQSAQELELLSMRHARTGDNMTVTGLVRNRGEAASAAIMAVVFVFDRDGGFVASGRAPLEFARIAKGDESPFQVTIPDVKEVGRYRVSFRTESGIVPHVDRRATLQVAN